MLVESNTIENKDDLEYSFDAISTESLFFSDVNDINIFVEDKDQEYVYENIFKRLMGNKYRIGKIFGVGGKEALKKHFYEFKSRTQEDIQSKNIYVADGDFDRYIYAEEMIRSDNFIYLKTYNIENYYIDKYASENYAKGHLKMLDNQVEEKVGFNNWKDKIVKQASKLFFYYCYVKKNYPTEKTVSRSAYRFINNDDGLEKNGAFEQYKKEVLSLNSNAEKEVENIKNVYHKFYKDDFNIICGKFLFESLYCHMQSILNRRAKKEDFRWSLICNFDIGKLEYIKEKILCYTDK